jgi:hypothetical protein
MTPINSSEGYVGIPGFENCYPPWMNPDCNYPLDVTAEGIYNPSYDGYTLQSTGPPSSYLTPETLDISWGARNGSVSTTNTSTDSPVTELSSLGADTDANRVPDLVPSGEPKKRGSDSLERPPKRNCSQTVGTGPRTAGPATRSKENRPPAPCKATKSKADDKSKTSKKSTDKSRSSSSSTTSPRGGSGGTHKAPQLRTASRKPKANGKESGSPPTAEDKDNEEDDLLTPDERRARHSHNLVEKQYRNRLNQQFESLLAVLPPADSGNRCFPGSSGSKSRPRDAKGSVVGVEGAGDDRRLSKAEVLDMARQRIVTLERECDRLRSEMMELSANVGVVRDAVAKGGIAGTAVAA